MNLKFISLVIAALAVGGIMVFQATRETTALVKLPSDLVALGTEGKMSRIRVAGKVAEGSVEYSVQPEIVLRFKIQDPGKADPTLPTVAVVYNGLKPDMFAPGRDVIIDGEYGAGTLHASKLLTQCPSKYEPPSVEKQLQDHKKSL